MTTKTSQDPNDSLFYCTFTCFDWLHLFEITDFYQEFYQWFDILIEKGCKIIDASESSSRDSDGTSSGTNMTEMTGMVRTEISRWNRMTTNGAFEAASTGTSPHFSWKMPVSSAANPQ
jgi:hypothetical protein